MKHNILLINNTEKYHSGCKAVINFYRHEFIDHNLTIANNLDKIDLQNYDLVVANGEGTMHDDNDKVYKIMEILEQAKKHNNKTMLVNTVWQNNSAKLTKMLKNVDYVSVRETKSKKEILKCIQRRVDIHLDYSYFCNVKLVDNKTKYNLAVGNKMNIPNVKPKRPKISNVGEDARVDIFKQGWHELVNFLYNSELFVTGRHHEMYASCKAECPFVVLEGNTHKNSGLFETANVDIPYLSMNASNSQIVKQIKNIENYKEQFVKLFQYMKAQVKPELLKNVEMV
jgi:exopolysaccharide biosynthesis predicted pyruvyltransferase EpsI